MDSPRNLTSLEEIKKESLENIQPEEPTVEPSTSLKSVFEDLHSQPPSSENIFELPEGVQYFPPHTTDSSQSLQLSLKSPSRCSTYSRLDALARPKSHCLEETLQRFGKTLSRRSVENLKKQLHDQNVLRVATERVHLTRCTHTPTPQPPSGRRSPVNQQQRDQVLQKFNARLKRETFNRLADKIFAKLPHLILEADITDLSQQAPSMQRMINVIFTTIISYAGIPFTVHDHELYLHLSVGLTRFIEGVMSSVRQQIHSTESISTQEREPRQQRSRGRCSMTTDLLGDLSEKVINIQRPREIMKPKISKIENLKIDN